MIITRTPYRISLFGGGSDFPQWYKEHGGRVLAFSIDKYSYLTARHLPPFFSHNYRVSYSRNEETKTIDQMEHPAFREAIRLYGQSAPLEVHHHGDLPARSGIGSSSAFAVGIINALNVLNGKYLHPMEIADLAIKLEQVVLNENVGSQDQITCSIGGINLIEFSTDGKWKPLPLLLSKNYKDEISDRAVLFYSGISRLSSDISKTLVENISYKEKCISRLMEIAKEGHELLANKGDLDGIGELLNESMQLKTELNPSSINCGILDLLKHAKMSGAIGAKILGAGGGGFFLFWTKQGYREDFISKFKAGVVVPFNIESAGSQVIFSKLD
jgi:D-glycero-alpha-D-manno-heptose-7-phosphate kinase